MAVYTCFTVCVFNCNPKEPWYSDGKLPDQELPGSSLTGGTLTVAFPRKLFLLFDLMSNVPVDIVSDMFGRNS